MRVEGRKPVEVLALGLVCEEAFDVLRRSFDVPERYSFDLQAVDHLAEHTADVPEIAAFAMRGLQVLRAYAVPLRPVAADRFVAVASSSMPLLEKLADLSSDDSDRALLLGARESIYAATWAVMRESGPDVGPCLLR